MPAESLKIIKSEPLGPPIRADSSPFKESLKRKSFYYNKGQTMEFLIVSGMSGAGKSRAADVLEGKEYREWEVE